MEVSLSGAYIHLGGGGGVGYYGGGRALAMEEERLGRRRKGTVVVEEEGCVPREREREGKDIDWFAATSRSS